MFTWTFQRYLWHGFSHMVGVREHQNCKKQGHSLMTSTKRLMRSSGGGGHWCQQWDWKGACSCAAQRRGKVWQWIKSKIPKRSLYYIDDVRATFLNYFLWNPLLRAVHFRVVMAARRGDVLDQIKKELVVSGGEARAEVNRFNQG